MRILLFTSLTILIILIQELYASGAYPIPDSESIIVGRPQKYIIKNRETLIDIAREFDLGYNEIAFANRNIDPWIPVKGTEILIPTIWIVPEIMDKGILINLAGMRLYLFFHLNNRRFIRTFPVGIGREGFDTPEGNYSIIAKVKDPVWKVPESIRKERPELPTFIPPGPDNPLGKYWLQLSIKGYGIHGTNRPYGIGRRVSHGCIRLYPEDMEVLARYTTAGMPVRIINEPVKIARDSYNRIYLQITNNGLSKSQLKKIIIEKLNRTRLLNEVDKERLDTALQDQTGLPILISN